MVTWFDILKIAIDVITIAISVGGGCWYVVKAIRHRLAQLDIHHEELEDHRQVLKEDVGWTPDPNRGLSRKGAA